MKEVLRDLVDEIKEFSAKIKVFDIFVPPLLFWFLISQWGFTEAVIAVLILTVLVTGIRVIKNEPLLYVSFGFIGVLLTALSSRFVGDALGVVAPDILINVVLMISSVLSLYIGIPLVSLTSHLFRQWPRDWYLHEKIKPAYLEATLLWTLFFLLRSVLLYYSVDEDTADTVVKNFILGWPLTISLLIATYMYGTYRLKSLKGPSVQEFIIKADSPWEGQRKGF